MQIIIYMHGTPLNKWSTMHIYYYQQRSIKGSNFDPFILCCYNDAGPVNDIHVSSVGR